MSNVTDNERLMVLVEARITDLEKNFKKASATTAREFGRMRRDSQSATRAMEADVVRSTTRINQALATTSSKIGALAATYAGGRGMGGVGIGGVAGAIGAFLSVQSATRLTDSATQITNALKVAGLEGEALTAVYNELFEAAQRNSAPLEALVTLYGRAAVVQNELGVSSEELLSFTNNVALALRVAGTDAQSASGALLQLSQALGSGTIRAEEFNSILEGALPIAQAAAAGIEEAGGSVARLRQLVVDGKVSSEAFFRGFEAGAAMLEDKVAGAESTVSQAFVRLMNVLTDTAGKLNEGTGASEEMAGALDELGGWIASIDFSPLIGGVLDFAAAIAGTIAKVHELAGALGDLTGASAIGPAIMGRRTQDAIQSRIDGAFEATAGTGMEEAPGTVVDVPGGGITPISIDMYPVGGAAGGGGKASGRKGRAGGGRGGAPRQNDFERETAQLEKRTAAILAETNAMAGLNPLLDDYGFAIERARAEHDLLTAAQEAGVAVTPELRSQIDALAEGYANATAEAKKLGEAQDDARRRAEEWGSTAKDTIKGFVSDMRSGTDATESLNRAIDRLISQLMDRALDGLFDSLFSPGSGTGANSLGSIGKAFAGLFGGGKATGGAVDGSKFYLVGEKGPELFAPGRSGTVIPNHVIAGQPQQPTRPAATARAPQIRQTFINAPPVANQTEERDENGNINQTVMFEQMVASALNRQGSAANRVLAGRGVPQRLRRT